jgi:hypothetical protein
VVIIQHPVFGSLHVIKFTLLHAPDEKEPAGQAKKKGQNKQKNQRTVHGSFLEAEGLSVELSLAKRVITG